MEPPPTSSFSSVAAAAIDAKKEISKPISKLDENEHSDEDNDEDDDDGKGFGGKKPRKRRRGKGGAKKTLHILHDVDELGVEGYKVRPLLPPAMMAGAHQQQQQQLPPILPRKSTPAATTQYSSNKSFRHNVGGGSGLTHQLKYPTKSRRGQTNYQQNPSSFSPPLAPGQFQEPRLSGWDEVDWEVSALMSMVDNAAHDPLSMESLVHDLALALPEISLEINQSQNLWGTSLAYYDEPASMGGAGGGEPFSSFSSSSYSAAQPEDLSFIGGDSWIAHRSRTSRGKTWGSSSSLALLSHAVAAAAVLDESFGRSLSPLPPHEDSPPFLPIGSLLGPPVQSLDAAEDFEYAAESASMHSLGYPALQRRQSNLAAMYDPEREARVAHVVELAENERHRRISEAEEVSWKDRLDRAARIEWAVIASETERLRRKELDVQQREREERARVRDVVKSQEEDERKRRVGEYAEDVSYAGIVGAAGSLASTGTESSAAAAANSAVAAAAANDIQNASSVAALQDYEVICPYSVLGCEVTLLRSELPEHFNSCEFRAEVLEARKLSSLAESYNPLEYIVMCPYAVMGCNVSCARVDIPSHLAICPYRAERQGASAAAADSYEIVCPYTKLGCTFTCTRLQLQSHMSECSFRPSSRQEEDAERENMRASVIKAEEEERSRRVSSPRDRLESADVKSRGTLLEAITGGDRNPLSLLRGALKPPPHSGVISMPRRASLVGDDLLSGGDARSRRVSWVVKAAEIERLRKTEEKLAMRQLEDSSGVISNLSGMSPLVHSRQISNVSLISSPPASPQRPRQMSASSVSSVFSRQHLPLPPPLVGMFSSHAHNDGGGGSNDRGEVFYKSEPFDDQGVDSPPGRRRIVLEAALRRQRLHNAQWYPAESLVFKGRRTHVHTFHNHMEHQTRLLHKTLHEEIESFGQNCALWELASQSSVNALIEKIRGVVENTWSSFVATTPPSVHVFGSFASELTVPGVSDLDLVVVPGREAPKLKVVVPDGGAETPESGSSTIGGSILSSASTASLATSPLDTAPAGAAVTQSMVTSPAGSIVVQSAVSPAGLAFAASAVMERRTGYRPPSPMGGPAGGRRSSSFDAVFSSKSSGMSSMSTSSLSLLPVSSLEAQRALIRDRFEAARRCRILGEALSKTLFLKDVRVIDTASVPVIMMRTFDVRPSLDIDLTVALTNHDGIAAADFVKMLRARFPPLMPLVRLLKAFLFKRGLGDPFRGGVSSYALVLMTSCSLIRSCDRVGPRQAPLLSHGELLVDFLDLFGREFDAQHEAVVCNVKADVEKLGIGRAVSSGPPLLRIGSRLESLSAGYSTSAEVSLVVDDPIRPGNNVGRPSFAFARVQHAFAEVLAQLLSHVVRNEALGRRKIRGDSPLLERIFGVPQLNMPPNDAAAPAVE